MSALDKTMDEIKKKMTMSDYMTAINEHIALPAKQQKVKVTVYLTEDHWKMFNELCMVGMKASGKPEKSQVICEAIQCYYKQVCG